MELYISSEDKKILREKAVKQLELANMERNQKLTKMWYNHNELQGERPMIHLEMETFSHEILPQRMQCKGTFARVVEKQILDNYLNQELFDDDRVTPDYYPLEYDQWFRLFDVDVKIQHTTGMGGAESLGHHFIPVLKNLEEDYGKLKKSTFGIEIASTMKKKEVIEDAIGDILPVKLITACLYSVPTQMLVHIMDMQDMMLAMYDDPELFLEMMDRIAEDTLAYYRLMEEKQIILPTVAGEPLGQGSWCYNRTLPGNADRPLKSTDVFGFMDSQETVGISPDMYEEFIFPCYQKIASQFGLLSYGCCEPVHPIWERCLSKLPNLRKISISPWCEEEYMGEQLRGSRVIYHRKPSPNYLGVDKILDEDAFRGHIRKSLKAAAGCEMEITQRDVYTIHNNVEKAHRYIEIIKEEIADHWQKG